MAPHSTVDVIDGPPASSPPPYPVDGSAPKPRKRKWVKVLVGLGILVVVLVVAAVVWFFVGRDEARQLSDQKALENLQKSGAGPSSDATGIPAVGVYSATASGSESVGVPGLDENLGPNAPVTVTHGEGGCFTYRVDFNSHYWRNWTMCPTADATFGIAEMVSRTGRVLPGVTVESLATYTCQTPIPVLWSGAAAGDQRSGSCTGVVADDEGVTADAGSVEVLDLSTVDIAGESVDVVHLRTTETLTDAQTGSEVDEWWIDASNGLPVRIEFGIATKASRDYKVTGTLELTTLTPAT